MGKGWWMLGLLFFGAFNDEVPEGFVAVGEGLEIRSEEYYEYLDSRLRTIDVGKSLLQQLIREIAIENEAERRGVEVTEDELNRRVESLDRRFRVTSGGEKGLDDYIREKEVDKGDFMWALRLSIAHEAMARADFEVKAHEELPVEKLNVWLTELLNRTKVETIGDDSNLVARVDGKDVTRVHFGKRLSTLISSKKSESLLTELIGIRLIHNRAAKMDIALEESDCDREIAEREAQLKSKPGLSGISYANYLEATSGQSLAALRVSDKFRGEVLLKKICESLHHEAFLQDHYEKNRACFNRRFGRAARISTIFLKAIKFDNPLTEKYKYTDRKFDEAVEELKAIKGRLERDEVNFENMARIYSEHESAKSGGDLGFIPPGTEGWETVAEEALNADVGALLGPLTFPDGCHLIKVCDKRDDPTYERIRDEVRRHARQVFYERLIEEAKVKRKF